MKKSYFLISVSNKENLDLCIKYALAGFTSSINGVWTFVEVQEGDFVSFLYGAKAYNLYVVEAKEAIKDAEPIQPWPSITFKQSGRTYCFPFWLHLRPVRRFEEPLIRAEFAYVAENLLLRGGYRKTHFQADQTTLQAVSQMGNLWDVPVEQLGLSDYSTFTPRFTSKKDNASIPEVFHFHEFILQSLVRRYLCEKENLSRFLSDIGIQGIPYQEFEILGEKAFPQGHVDILIKEATPLGTTRKIIIELKRGVAKEQDLIQLRDYAKEIGDECIGAVLIAKRFSRTLIKSARDTQIKLAAYSLSELDEESASYTFENLLQNLNLEIYEH